MNKFLNKQSSAGNLRRNDTRVTLNVNIFTIQLHSPLIPAPMTIASRVVPPSAIVYSEYVVPVVMG